MKSTVLSNSLTSALIITTHQAANVLMPLYAIEYFSASMPQVGYLFTAFFLSSTFSKIFAGIFVKQKYLKHLLILSTLLITISIASYVIVPSVAYLMLVRIVHGIGFGITITACLTIASLIVEKEMQSYSVSLFAVFTVIGLIVGPLVGTFGTLFYDIPKTLLIVSFISLIAFFLAAYTIKDRMLKCSYDDMHEIVLKRFDFVREGWFMLNFMAYFAYALIYGTLVAYVPPYVKQNFGLNDYYITALFFIFSIFSLASRIILTKHSPTEFLKKILVFSLGISILMMALISFSNSLIMFVIEFPLIGLGHGFIYPITALFISKNSPQDKRFMANTIYLISFDLGNAIGPIIASSLTTILPLNLVFVAMTVFPTMLLIYLLMNIRSLNC